MDRWGDLWCKNRESPAYLLSWEGETGVNWAGKGLFGWRWPPLLLNPVRNNPFQLFSYNTRRIWTTYSWLLLFLFHTFHECICKRIFVDAGCRAFQMWAQRSQDLYFKWQRLDRWTGRTAKSQECPNSSMLQIFLCPFTNGGNIEHLNHLSLPNVLFGLLLQAA